MRHRRTSKDEKERHPYFQRIGHGIREDQLLLRGQEETKGAEKETRAIHQNTKTDYKNPHSAVCLTDLGKIGRVESTKEDS